MLKLGGSIGSRDCDMLLLGQSLVDLKSWAIEYVTRKWFDFSTGSAVCILVVSRGVKMSYRRILASSAIHFSPMRMNCC